MTPLEAAQKMLTTGQPQGIGADCPFCSGSEVPVPEWHFDHAPDCPWLQMPQIIAALEAYEKVTA